MKLKIERNSSMFSFIVSAPGSSHSNHLAPTSTRDRGAMMSICGLGIGEIRLSSFRRHVDGGCTAKMGLFAIVTVRRLWYYLPVGQYTCVMAWQPSRNDLNFSETLAQAVTVKIGHSRAPHTNQPELLLSGFDYYHRVDNILRKSFTYFFL
jgi:hypothetical protein